MNLGSVLRALVADLEAGRVPPGRVARIERALGAPLLRRLHRDYWLRVALMHCASIPDLHRTLTREHWRLALWLRRGGPPATAPPLLVALFNAVESGAPVPTLRQTRRILGTRTGAAMSRARVETARR